MANGLLLHFISFFSNTFKNVKKNRQNRLKVSPLSYRYFNEGLTFMTPFQVDADSFPVHPVLHHILHD